MRDRETLDLVARCLEYPGPGTARAARIAAERATADEPGLAHALWHLAVGLETAPLGEAEERYSALFDLNPVCTLHVGYHVFGDSYPRGAFIAGLARELRQAGVEWKHDLPDFLPTVLRLMARLPEEDASVLAERILRPALAKMAKALEGSSSPWSKLLAALPGLFEDRPAAAAAIAGEQPLQEASHA